MEAWCWCVRWRSATIQQVAESPPSGPTRPLRGGRILSRFWYIRFWYLPQRFWYDMRTTRFWSINFYLGDLFAFLRYNLLWPPLTLVVKMKLFVQNNLYRPGFIWVNNYDNSNCFWNRCNSSDDANDASDGAAASQMSRINDGVRL